MSDIRMLPPWLEDRGRRGQPAHLCRATAVLLQGNPDLEQGYSTLTLRGLEPAGFLFYLIVNCTHLVSQV